MVESQRYVMKPELYERLIVRLGHALDAASTAARLRDERPAELELRGLSHAEFELIRAYLDLSGQDVPVPFSVLEYKVPPRSAEIIWLKDKMPNPGSAKFKSAGVK
ncbi:MULTISPECIES: hypothetical protein [Pseudomonas]|uniref:Uncharacterized protein n=1 Tax=Pseudomonas gingeri TaxID=117681 RepID=A0A7Y7WQE4_9PSED|nr:MULTISPECIES: hypothetical protein [Pseudomonas]MPQ70891.1 hypothetical protein [Pseudomonas sp. MWU12-2323]NWB84388.1 hypothetical protein [Pseudomonas gingeri]